MTSFRKWIWLLLLCSPVVCHAEASVSLNICIQNSTNNMCYQTNARAVHGMIYEQSANDIAPQKFACFDITNIFLFGPELEVSYECGDKHVTIDSQQDLGHIWNFSFDYGEVHLTVPNADEGIYAYGTHGPTKYDYYTFFDDDYSEVHTDVNWSIREN